MLLNNLPKFVSVLLSEVLLKSVLYQIWQLLQWHGQEPENKFYQCPLKCSKLQKSKYSHFLILFSKHRFFQNNEMLTGSHVVKFKSPATEDYSIITTPNQHCRILQELFSHSTTLHLYRTQNEFSHDNEHNILSYISCRALQMKPTDSSLHITRTVGMTQ